MKFQELINLNNAGQLTEKNNFISFCRNTLKFSTVELCTIFKCKLLSTYYLYFTEDHINIISLESVFKLLKTISELPKDRKRNRTIRELIFDAFPQENTSRDEFKCLLKCLQGTIVQKKILQNIIMEKFHFIAPQLAKPIRDMNALKITNDMIYEKKFDGERIILIKNKNENITIFSRNQKIVPANKLTGIDLSFLQNDDQCILDGELLYIDKHTNEFVSFFKRGVRQRMMNDNNNTIPIIKFFDCLGFNNELYTNSTLAKRYDILKKILGVNHQHLLSEQYPITSKNTINEILEKIDFDKIEGIIIKTLHGRYESNKRKWLKYKCLYSKNRIDKDLAIIGANYGTGKNDKIFSSFIMSQYNSTTKKFEAICKVHSGINQETLINLNRLIVNLQTTDSTKFDFKKYKPNIMIQPQIICEIYADSMTENSLRFPVFKSIRSDKIFPSIIN